MSLAVVETLTHADGLRRVQLFQRDDGTFGFCKEHFSTDPFEQCWIPHWPASECIAASLDVARREAYGRVDWLTRGQA